LTSHFGFRLDRYIAKVTNQKRDKAVGTGILDRVKAHIIGTYNSNPKYSSTHKKRINFGKILVFIDNYKEFSEHVSGKSGRGMFRISNINYIAHSGEIVPLSWLLENLRYLFPKKFGLPIRDDELLWFLFRNIPSYGRSSSLTEKLFVGELDKRTSLTMLLSMDYYITKLKVEDFTDRGIDITNEDLLKLKQAASLTIQYFIFGGYHEESYVSATTSKNVDVGQDYFIPEYKVIRAIFFAVAEFNGGEPINLEQIVKDFGISDLKSHLFEGFGFGDSFQTILFAVRALQRSSVGADPLIFQDAIDVLTNYREVYSQREAELRASMGGYRSNFEVKLHKYINDYFGIKFAYELKIRDILGVQSVVVENDDGNFETIKLRHKTLDFYLKLTKPLREYLGLEEKWIGIAVSGQSSYWHTEEHPETVERDRQKRLVCKKENIIRIEVWYDWEKDEWSNKILDQFKALTGIRLDLDHLSKLGRYLGDREDS